MTIVMIKVMMMKVKAKVMINALTNVAITE